MPQSYPNNSCYTAGKHPLLCLQISYQIESVLSGDVVLWQLSRKGTAFMDLVNCKIKEYLPKKWSYLKYQQLEGVHLTWVI